MRHLTPFVLLLALLADDPVRAQAGALDPDFAVGGVFRWEMTDSAYGGFGEEVIALPDTSLIVCGRSDRDNTARAFIGHVLGNGIPDPLFGTDTGATVFQVGNFARAADVVRGADGTYYMAGDVDTDNGRFPALFHVLANGLPDPAFGDTGVVLLPVPPPSVAESIALQPDGKLLIAGTNGYSENGNALLLRAHPDGTLDSTFATDGIFVLPDEPTWDELQDIALLQDGSIVGVGYLRDSALVWHTMVLKWTAQGTLDTSFGEAGMLWPITDVATSEARSVVADGQRFYFCGVLGNTAPFQLYIARIGADGLLDAQFGDNGLLTATTGQSSLIARDIELQADGAPVVSGTTGEGTFTKDVLLWRCDTTGVPDQSFGPSGIHVNVDPGSTFNLGLAVQPDGKLVTSGYFGAPIDLVYMRNLVDGSVDVTRPALPALAAPWPDPATDRLNVALPAGARSLRIFDGEGRTVLEERVQAMCTSASLGIGELAPATYFVEAELENGARLRARWVKW